jgi:hypothetical protein
MATLDEIRRYLGTLSATLWNYGANFPVPTLDRYDSGEVGFSFVAILPGVAVPRPAEIELAEIWSPDGPDDFCRYEYDFDFVEYPLNRRRAFHGHDPEHFRREFGVLVHDHCEERLGEPAFAHCFGLPIDGYEAIRRFASLGGHPGPLGCAELRCMV